MNERFDNSCESMGHINSGADTILAAKTSKVDEIDVSIFQERITTLAEEMGGYPRLAKVVGVPRPTVYRWTQGYFPTGYYLKLICTNCAVSADWLLGINEEGGPQ